MNILYLTIFILCVLGGLAMVLYFVRCSKHLAKGNAEKIGQFKVHSDGTFRILQITDTHLTSAGTNTRDFQTLCWVKWALRKSHPDFVEVTGDVSGWLVKNRDSGLIAFANLMERKKIYWALTFGNHDGEYVEDAQGTSYQVGKLGKQNDVLTYCKHVTSFDETKGRLFYSDNTKGNAELFSLLKGYTYCVTKRDALEDTDADAMGVGNFVIDLLNEQEKPVFALIHMDTHGKMYFMPKEASQEAKDGIDTGYVGLTQKQIDWYRNVVKPYSEQGISSALFMHIASFGYHALVEDLQGFSEIGIPRFVEKPNPEQAIQKFKDTKFIKKEEISAPFWDDGLEDAMLQFPSTNLIAVGHEHDNCFYALKNIETAANQKQEVIYAYGRCSGVNAWGRRIPIGATVYDIDTTKHTPQEIYTITEIYPPLQKKS